MRILRGLITQQKDEFRFDTYGEDAAFLEINNSQDTAIPLTREEWEELKRQGDLFFEDIKEK